MKSITMFACDDIFKITMKAWSPKHRRMGPVIIIIWGGGGGGGVGTTLLAEFARIPILFSRRQSRNFWSERTRALFSCPHEKIANFSSLSVIANREGRKMSDFEVSEKWTFDKWFDKRKNNRSLLGFCPISF